MKKSLTREALLLATKNFLNEGTLGFGYSHGHYPTSDENETAEHDRMPENNQHGLQIKLSNGKVVFCLIVPLSQNLIHAGFTCNGERWETFELPKTKSNYFSKFKNKIEAFYDTQFVDEDSARDSFDQYMSVIFN